MMLEVNNLKINYGGVKAVKGVDFCVNKGEIVTIIGANGAGKSSILNCIAGLIDPAEGKILFEGEDITGLSPNVLVKKGISLSPEDRDVFPEMSVFENLEMGAYTRHKHDDIDKSFEEVYRLFPILAERKSQDGGTLSGGEQQMLSIAKCLMAKPKLLILDEPSLGLAPLVLQNIFSTINNLRKYGLTVLLVEQNARMALSIADRAYVMENGKIEMEGTSDELKDSEEIIKLYLGTS